MITKILAVLFIVSGSVIASALLYGQRGYFWLLMVGEKTSGLIVDISPAGEQALTRSRYNFSSPTSVQAYNVSVRFQTASLEYLATSRLDYYQLNALVDGQLTLDPELNRSRLIGKPLAVIYLAQDPNRNEVDAAPGWRAYGYPLTGGLVFIGMGMVLWRLSAKR